MASKNFADDASEPLSPGLYVVATPIGNLEDITLRALRILRGVDRIACEDTRHTRKLLSHFDIDTSTVSCHEHNELARAEELIAELKAGARIALVSDAGMPGISDPGARFVAQAIAAGIAVFPIPGASAGISALAASGLNTSNFRFVGFPPARSGERRMLFESLRSETSTLVFYEAPHRILETLGDTAAIFGSGRNAVLARELTKVHEEFLRGTIGELSRILSQRDLVRGEMTLLIAGAGTGESALQKSAGNLREQMSAYISKGLDEQGALKRIARERGVSKSEIYREWQRERGRAK